MHRRNGEVKMQFVPDRLSRAEICGLTALNPNTFQVYFLF